MCRLLVPVLVLSLLSCSKAPISSSTTGSTTVGFDAIARAVTSGSLRFELKDLANESEKVSYGVTFNHRGSVIALGDTVLTKLPYLVYFSVKRLSGGDPENPRRSNDMSYVYVVDGLGRFSEYGGYRGTSEKWDAEHIEVAPVAVFPGVQLRGSAVRE